MRKECSERFCGFLRSPRCGAGLSMPSVLPTLPHCPPGVGAQTTHHTPKRAHAKAAGRLATTATSHITDGWLAGWATSAPHLETDGPKSCTDELFLSELPIFIIITILLWIDFWPEMRVILGCWHYWFCTASPFLQQHLNARYWLADGLHLDAVWAKWILEIKQFKICLKTQLPHNIKLNQRSCGLWVMTLG